MNPKQNKNETYAKAFTNVYFPYCVKLLLKEKQLKSDNALKNAKKLFN